MLYGNILSTARARLLEGGVSMKKVFAAFGVAAAALAHANAATLFAEDFDDEVSSFGTVFNFTNFDTLTVSAGTVDLIASGAFGVSCDGSVGCIDLDGTTRGLIPASLLTSGMLTFNPGELYTLSFRYSGNQRNTAPDTLSYAVGNLVSGTIANIASNQPFTTVMETFSVQTVTQAAFTLGDPTVADNFGVIIDNISITSQTIGAQPIPLPAAPFLFASGAAALFASRRR